MENLWNIEDAKESVILPKDLIQKQCEYLMKSTGGKVIARISEYDGEYKSYATGGYNFGEVFAGLKEKNFDIQEKLGDNEEDAKLVYEFYLSSEKTPKYKYRIFFIYYGILIYPLGISLEASIANEIKMKPEFVINSEEEFILCLGKILQSSKVKMIVKNLWQINK